MAERLWAYLVTRADHRPPADASGVCDRPVLAIAEGELAIWVSPLDAPPAADIGQIRRHNDVILRATTPGITPVPLRFGQLTGEAALRASLADPTARWAAWLDEFAGAAEFGVRVTGEAEARNLRPAAPPSGRAFLEALAARRRRSEQMCEAIRDAVRDVVRREWVDAPAQNGVIARLSHLVGTAEQHAYRRAIQEVARVYPECTFDSSGPWPPWSFAA